MKDVFRINTHWLVGQSLELQSLEEKCYINSLTAVIHYFWQRAAEEATCEKWCVLTTPAFSQLYIF